MLCLVGATQLVLFWVLHPSLPLRFARAEEHPGLGLMEITKKLSELYKAASEEELAPFKVRGASLVGAAPVAFAAAPGAILEAPNASCFCPCQASAEADKLRYSNDKAAAGPVAAKPKQERAKTAYQVMRWPGCCSAAVLCTSGCGL